MSALVMEASKMLENLDEDSVKMVISYIGMLSMEKPKRINKRIGILEGQYPDISIEELNWCNDEIAEMFASEE